MILSSIIIHTIAIHFHLSGAGVTGKLNALIYFPTWLLWEKKILQIIGMVVNTLEDDSRVLPDPEVVFSHQKKIQLSSVTF